MSFWNTSDGNDVTDNVEKEYDGGGGGFPLIPEKTNCLALLHSAAWDKNQQGDRYIKIRWDIQKHEAYRGTVIFQRLWVKDDDPHAKDPVQKRDNALRMFAAIDANAGGKLARSGREPDDDDLAMALTNKTMMIEVRIWEINGKEGNWIKKIGPKGGSMTITEPEEAPRPKARKPETKKPLDDDLDDDVPF